MQKPGFTYSDCRPFTKNKERIKRFKETGDSSYLYQNELDKAWFQNNMAQGESDKVLHDKAFHIAKKQKYDGHQHGLASTVYKLFDKKTSGIFGKKQIMSNEQLAKELHKSVIRKC